MDENTTPKDLAATWRERADLLREWGGGEGAARVWEKAAAELEVALRTHEQAALTLPEAAQESGYSADHLGALVREGNIPNAGRPGAPRILRRDLPRKSTTHRRNGNGRGDGRMDDLIRDFRSSKQNR